MCPLGQERQNARNRNTAETAGKVKRCKLPTLCRKKATRNHDLGGQAQKKAATCVAAMGGEWHDYAAVPGLATAESRR
jgi:hypothetical protein